MILSDRYTNLNRKLSGFIKILSNKFLFLFLSGNFAKKKDLYKLIPRILLFLFILAQLYFVIAIVKEKNINTWFVVVFILMAVILFLDTESHRDYI